MREGISLKLGPLQGYRCTFTAAVEMRPRAPSPDRLRHGRLRPPM